LRSQKMVLFIRQYFGNTIKIKNLINWEYTLLDF